MSSQSEPSIWAALEQIAALLETKPADAESRALAILESTPGQPQALRAFVLARLRKADPTGARSALETLARETPGIAAISYELGVLLRKQGSTEEAVAALYRAVKLAPHHPQAQRALNDALSDSVRADNGFERDHEDLESGCARLRLMETASRGPDDQLPQAESLLRECLSLDATDVFAKQMLGSVYIRLRRYEDAERELTEALDLAPDFLEARWMLAGTFFYRGKWQATLAQADRLLEKDPDKPEYLDLKTHALLHLGEFDAAIACYESALSEHSTAENWKSYGHALKVVGRREEAITAYRKAITLNHDYGVAWWCLADLKTFRFVPAEIEAMHDVLKKPDLTSQNRARFHFALGKAFEDEEQYNLAFAQFEQANAAMKSAGGYRVEDRTQFVRRCKTVFTPGFLRDRSEWGSSARDPIFVVGLPRSGTTLIEQILASHSQVEATIELQVLESVVRRLSLDDRRREKRFPELLQQADREEIRSAADEYLAETRIYRKSGGLFFIDKMPNNFNYLGLILLMLPGAKVIDARRHPLGGGFAIFKHYFAQGYGFTFDLADIGRYYRAYVELMAHFDSVTPGRVHRVFHEQMVANTEPEIRRLLDYCGLPFEEQCLRFYESKRAVLTPSSEQVRRPISAEAAELWRHYEAWLGPLKSVLGDVLETYPGVPDFPEVARDAEWRISSVITNAQLGQTSSVRFKSG